MCICFPIAFPQPDMEVDNEVRGFFFFFFINKLLFRVRVEAPNDQKLLAAAVIEVAPRYPVTISTIVLKDSVGFLSAFS